MNSQILFAHVKSVFPGLAKIFPNFSTPPLICSLRDKKTGNGVVSYDSLFLNDGDIGSLDINSGVFTSRNAGTECF